MAIVKMNAGASQEKFSVELTKEQLWTIRRATNAYSQILAKYENLRKHYTGAEWCFPVPESYRDCLFDVSIYWEDEIEECDYLLDLLDSVYLTLSEFEFEDVFD